MTPAELRQAIPALLRELGLGGQPLEGGADAWTLRAGEVEGYVAILGADDPGADPFLHVKFRLFPVPPSHAEGFLRTLLAVNHDLGNFASFSLDQHDVAWLGAGRFGEDVEPPELRELVTQVARLAERYVADFHDTFGDIPR